jgi:hypothetical protein
MRGEHGDLRGVDRRNVISYVYEKESCISMCVTLFKVKLNLVSHVVRDGYIVT